jgi:diaminopimelate epimerase
MRINILKCHGSGNDFILIDEYRNSYNFTEEERREIAIALCDRNGLIGADGILYFQRSSSADARMRIFNADGSEPEMCGNGIRCIGRYACELLGRDTVTIETMKKDLSMKKREEIYPGVPTYEVVIEPVSFKPESLPINVPGEKLIDGKIEELSANLTFTAVSVPNPHIITIVKDIDERELVLIGEKANSNKDILPRGVNVSFVKIMGGSTIFVQTYERGVGLTNACGTAMSASSLVSCLLGYNKLDKEIKVFNKGGMVKCEVNQSTEDNNTIKLIGNGSYVFSCDVDFDFNKPSNSRVYEKTMFNGEIENYEKLVDYVKSEIK